MNPIWGEKAIVYALAQAVLVYRATKVTEGVPRLFVERRGRHAQLKCGLEVFKDLTPRAVGACAPPMCLVDDDQIKEVGRILAIKTGAELVLSDGLVNVEVHF